MSDKELIIRLAKPEDFSIIQKLNNEVFIDNASYDKHLDLRWPFSEKGIGYFKKVLAANDHCCLLAEMNGRPVGYLIGGPKDLDYRSVTVAEIHNTGVSPDYRSQGVGAKLLDRFRVWCREHGYQKVYVNAYYLNTRAISFYKRQGLTPIDISLEMDA